MTATPNFSLDYLADTMISRLDRGRIFPPHLNNPEDLLSVPCNRTNKPTRPPNGFLLCRKNVHHQAKQQGMCNMRVISKVTGMLWRSASPEEKEMYEDLANQVSVVYAQRYNDTSIPSYLRSIPSAYMPYTIHPPHATNNCAPPAITYQHDQSYIITDFIQHHGHEIDNPEIYNYLIGIYGLQ
ncbi:16891_t:CDS:1 [Entrophospora sp. SA101]|nr:9189_t:CDS:1 [Entrophospora candida]CAH1765624.1 1120_t:CDS:1 [Entrophospora sp. SA101]CAG8609579.1 4298_t:CDS:1 [Entrophospora candida]CAJ0758741.1 16891_t:CDS:1 [Entrophospora sp. SA101]CAJ0849898.1 527_t:CDS:1 [Entrophospora sp. SA101]